MCCVCRCHTGAMPTLIYQSVDRKQVLLLEGVLLLFMNKSKVGAEVYLLTVPATSGTCRRDANSSRSSTDVCGCTCGRTRPDLTSLYWMQADREEVVRCTCFMKHHHDCKMLLFPCQHLSGDLSQILKRHSCNASHANCRDHRVKLDTDRIG